MRKQIQRSGHLPKATQWQCRVSPVYACGCARVDVYVLYNYGVCVEKSGKMDTGLLTVVTHRVETTNGPLPAMFEILNQIK